MQQPLTSFSFVHVVMTHDDFTLSDYVTLVSCMDDDDGSRKQIKQIKEKEAEDQENKSKKKTKQIKERRCEAAKQIKVFLNTTSLPTLQPYIYLA